MRFHISWLQTYEIIVSKHINRPYSFHNFFLRRKNFPSFWDSRLLLLSPVIINLWDYHQSIFILFKWILKSPTISAKTMSAHVQVIKGQVKSKEVKAKIPEGSSQKFKQLAYTAHLKLGKHVHAHTAKVHRLCRPASKVTA